MDISYWKQYHPKIHHLGTTHLMFRQYAYRLVVTLPGAAMLRCDKDFAMQMAEEKRIINYGGSWRPGPAKAPPSAADLLILEKLREYKRELPDGLKIRIESPSIQFYATSEALLKKLHHDIFHGVDSSRYLVSITGPRSPDEFQLIEQGFVIKKKGDYPFKVHIRDGRYSHAVRSQLLSLLDAQGAQVKIPRATRHMMTKNKGDYLWGCYFWCQDESLQFMIGIIHPQAIRTIERFVDPSDK